MVKKFLELDVLVREQYLAALGEVCSNGQIYECDKTFQKALEMGLMLCGPGSAAALQRETRISHTTVSRWRSGHNMPYAPTRRTVAAWLQEGISKDLEKYRAELA